MKTLRTVIFWMHLVAGTTLGLAILVMSATGALLALKPQILNLVEHDVRMVQPPQTGGGRIGGQQLLAVVRLAKPDAQPASLSVDRDPSASLSVSLGRDLTMFVDPYTGRVLGEGSKRTQLFFRALEDWHRWLAVSAERRPAARSVTGAGTLAFCGLAMSGMYLWWPRKWQPQHVKAILTFKHGAAGRARDFNWHHVIGFWCAPILIVLSATGIVMSYPWANALLYRAMGSTPPVAASAETPAGRGAGAGAAERRAVPHVNVADRVDDLWARAEQQLPTWRTMTMRLPSRPGAPVAFTMTDARSWNAYARSQLTLDVATGRVVQWSPYEASSLGQKARGWVRFAHTGELGGLTTQLLAGVASAGGMFLVWTGFALALRRFLEWRPIRSWRSRRRTPDLIADAGAPAGM